MKKTLLTTFLLLFIALTSFSQVDLQLGLIASYPFNGNANDDSGNNLNGTVSGASLATDRFGQTNSAYTFGGGYISVPSNSMFNTGDEISVSAWVKLNNAATNQKVVGRCDLSFNSGFILAVQSGLIYGEIWNSMGTHYQMNTYGTVASAQWVHLVLTYANSLYFTAYVNGIAVDSVPVAAYQMGSNTDNLVIGIAPWNLLNFPVSGQIDDVRIYNRQINPAEVQALFNLPVGIHSAEKSGVLRVFPNPSASGEFNLASPERIQSIQVVNALGALVYSKDAINDNLFTLEMSMLDKGIYFVSVETASGITRREIVIN